MDDAERATRPPDQAPRRVADRAELVLNRESLTATTERVAVTTARLEKYLVTEQRTITVDVSREDVRLSYAPPTIGPGQHPSVATDEASRPAVDTVVLYAEEIDITRRWVPVETAHLQVTNVTTAETTTDTARAEHVDTIIESATNTPPPT